MSLLNREQNAPSRYQIRQKLMAFGDDFYIENEHGQKVFKVDGKIMRIRETLVFRDMQGNPLCTIKEKLLTIRDTMEIEGTHGETLAVVKKALISPFRDHWIVKIGDGPDLKVQGNLLDHEYDIREGRKKVAEISRKWFRLRDTYGVTIKPGQNDILMLAVTVALDMMSGPAEG